VPVPSPEKLTIETPEQISLEFTLAGAGSRFLAVAIDTLIQIGVFIGILILGLGAVWLASSGFNRAANWAGAVLLFAAFLLYYGYFAAFEALWAGQTPGKRATGIRVIRTTGQPITPFDALVRNLLRIVDQLPGIYAVGVLSVFFTSRNQRLGDLAAGTVVVIEESSTAGAAALPRETGVRLGARRLTAEEIEVIQVFLRRRWDLPEFTRVETAATLAARIRERLAVPAALTLRDEELIELALAEYRGG
jgi:uncharacterized RDD family membrane protein YckC